MLPNLICKFNAIALNFTNHYFLELFQNKLFQNSYTKINMKTCIGKTEKRKKKKQWGVINISSIKHMKMCSTSLFFNFIHNIRYADWKLLTYCFSHFWFRRSKEMSQVNVNTKGRLYQVDTSILGNECRSSEMVIFLLTCYNMFDCLREKVYYCVSVFWVYVWTIHMKTLT